jgi:hypothetical protein
VVEPRFQDQIKNLSQAVKDKEEISFTAEEAAALFQGFVEMSQSIGSSAEIIEHLELQLAQAKRPKLWKP